MNTLRADNEAGVAGSKPITAEIFHNVLSSSNVVDVGQILFCHQPNFANDGNGLSYDG